MLSNSSDLWLRPTAAAGATATAASEIPWLPEMGALRINFACPPGTPVPAVARIIDAARRVRVGGDARYPRIVFWLASRVPGDILRSIALCDRTVPRIKVTLLHTGSGNQQAVDRAFATCKQLGLDTNVLVLLCGRRDATWQAAYSLLEAAELRSRVRFEWFPPQTPRIEWTDCLAAITALRAHNYDFLAHPLSLCGGIAYLVRARLLRPLGPPDACPAPGTHCPNELAQSTIALPCALAAICGALGDDQLGERPRCFCTFRWPDANAPGLEASELDVPLHTPTDTVLFEDWQYIYDGFDVV